MKTLFAYLMSRLKGEPICWAEAQYRARNMCEVKQVVRETIDRSLLRFVALLQTCKLFIWVDTGLRVDAGVQKLHAKMKSTAIGRYLIKVANAETDLRKIVKKYQPGACG